MKNLLRNRLAIAEMHSEMQSRHLKELKDTIEVQRQVIENMIDETVKLRDRLKVAEANAIPECLAPFIIKLWDIVEKQEGKLSDA